MPVWPFAFAKRKSALRFLTLPQYLLINGVLCFGGGMLVMTTLSRYLEWRYWHGASDPLGPHNVGERVVTWLLAGVVWGLISWMGRSTSNVQ
jgi:hypothetical protein